MKPKKTFKKHVCICFAVLFLSFTFYNPSAIYAEKSDFSKESTKITAMSVMLFYAGVVGALVGAATGWVQTWFFSPEPESEPVQKEKNKP